MLAIAHISYNNSVRPSVRLSQSGTDSSPGEIEFWFSPYDSLDSLVFGDKIWCRWVKGVLTNEGAKEGHPL